MATETISPTKTGCIVLAEDVEIPLGIQDLADFRKWALSDDFPERGRIDFLGNRIEVDMSPEDLFCHGSAKMEIGSVLYLHVQNQDLGFVFSDRTRISSPIAELSAEPDIVFLSHETLDENRARLVPKASGGEGRFVEIEGAVDLVVELWLVDARGENLQFHIHHRGESEFQSVAVDDDGFQFSEVLNRRYRLERLTSARGHWKYDLEEKEADK